MKTVTVASASASVLLPFFFLIFIFKIFCAAELGSDEDDIDEEGQEYLEMLAKQAGEDGDDDDWEEDDAEETALEGYTTTVDDEDNLVDEYQIFKAILQSKTWRKVRGN